MDHTLISPLLSVVICTLNRASLLRLAIESVLAQEVIPDSFELIVVDNGSTDDTHAVVEQLSAERKNMRYVFEEKQGLSHARNRGWREARGEYVIYIDDECILPSGYLETALQIIQQHNPDIFGGLIKAFYDYKKPNWVKKEYFSYFLDRNTGVLLKDEYVFGGNMGIRRDTLSRLGGFNINLGMKGNELAFSEEIDLQLRAIECQPGLEIYYDSNLWLYHRVRKEKLKLEWLLRYHFSKGFRGLDGLIAIRAYKSLPVHRKVVRILQVFVAVLYRTIRICARIPILMFMRNKKYRYWQQYLVERIFEVEIYQTGVYLKELEYGFLSFWGWKWQKED
jgi:glycosyltransferase involved in cell wall biosynthesis